jgi:lysophospholipase L1-like esterase
MLRTLAAAAFALLIGSASASATDATAFGDSFTAGRGWYSLLNLGNDNFAKSGAAANPAFGNSLAAQLKLWRAVERPTNDWVVVFIGINDIEEATTTFGPSRAAYTKALKELQAAGAKLILVQAPDLGQTPKFKGKSEGAELTKKTIAWNKFVAQQAGAFHAGLVNLFSKLSSSNLYGPDGFHPNSRGQQVIANAIAAKL